MLLMSNATLREKANLSSNHDNFCLLRIICSFKLLSCVIQSILKISYCGRGCVLILSHAIFQFISTPQTPDTRVVLPASLQLPSLRIENTSIQVRTAFFIQYMVFNPSLADLPQRNMFTPRKLTRKSERELSNKWACHLHVHVILISVPYRSKKYHHS